MTPAIREKIWGEVDAMLRDEIIERSTSGWSSPIVMVKKPNAKYRFCIDFKQVTSGMTRILDE